MRISEILGDLWSIVVFLVTVIVPWALAIAALVVVALFGIAALRFIAEQIRTLGESGGRSIERLIGAVAAAAGWFLDAAGLTLYTIGHLFFSKAGERRARQLFRVTPEQASRAASDRWNFVRANLEFAYRGKVIETPPGVPPLVLSENEANLDRVAAAAQVVRLQYEASAVSSSPELLLFARVRDALMCIARNSLIQQERLRMPSFDVSLRRLKFWERRRRRFEWVAVVGTDDVELFRAQLDHLQEWLGIGVDLARPLDVHLQRSCQHTPANTGTIAGGLGSVSGTSDYALTCSHVVPECANRRFPTLVPGDQIPDAALVKLHNGCLIPMARSGQLRPATIEEVKKLHSEEKLMRRLGGYSRRFGGWVSDRVVSYSVVDERGQSVRHEFSACIVRLKRNWYGPVVWPLFRRRFTKNGDSGSWVVVPKGVVGPEDVLLGMVHAGGIHGSYVILAEPLIAFFECLLANDNERAELVATPYRDT